MQNLSKINRNQLARKLQGLIEVLSINKTAVIALSGGVDSMLLSYIASKHVSTQIQMAHACSPAVPTDALERINRYAKKYGWSLSFLDAKELADKNYVNNPVNRCYFCKSNLYKKISESFPGLSILSGTNKDDLSDYRPGLIAASENGVRHPYVEADISKADIYELSRYFELSELQDLPAQPCLASRIETGIEINSNDLHFINNVEKIAKNYLSLQHTLRCRVTSEGVYFELENEIAANIEEALEAEIQRLCDNSQRKYAGIRRYSKGAAFIHV